ncbi:5-oxoprolinase/urea amidolyase family protein [Paenibacillus sp. LMG 31461]|uniref:5-oxoprolinase/urea amidolyase family protein n=1 Tax=Paenibacillus plantarum TaxID=2654975 RepID=A0ABX1X7E4_9BACL|nr:biotin-dependent carboxyltransferase family protein [Paenibacillus plantarum]NOU64353.1 5-oxoprolinase/urea amidolyase family protein [Paenibacillus plantarum]
MSFEVIKPGLLSTIQDEGRYGFRKHGVIVSGPMDRFAHRAANLLVGNGPEVATLEMTLQGPILVAQRDMLVAICGADMGAEVDGMAAPLWQPFIIYSGNELHLHYAAQGCRAYLAVYGGFKADYVLGSRSTYQRAAIGGYEGRALRAGDVLEAEKDGLASEVVNEVERRGKFVSSTILPYYRDNPTIRIVKGKEASSFTPNSWSRLLSQSFLVTSQSDRMGYRLSSEPKLELEAGLSYEMISEAVVAGTIQVPASGQPILLMADCQTTGGYPRIGHVITADLPLVAQVKPGGQLRFQEVTHLEAQEQLLLQAMDLKVLGAGIKTWLRGL